MQSPSNPLTVNVLLALDHDYVLEITSRQADHLAEKGKGIKRLSVYTPERHVHVFEVASAPLTSYEAFALAQRFIDPDFELPF